jgi:hypothetical protein
MMFCSCEELVTILNSNAEGKNEGHILAHIDWGIIFWAAPNSSSSICIFTYLIMSIERQCAKLVRTSHLTISKFTITQGCTPWWCAHRGTLACWVFSSREFFLANSVVILPKGRAFKLQIIVVFLPYGDMYIFVDGICSRCLSFRLFFRS